MLSTVKGWLNSQPSLSSELVIDLGMHNGEDTEYYLERGHRVVAVEANPRLVQEVSSRLQKHIDSGQLILLNAALFDRDNDRATFFISSMNSEWSGLYRDKLEPAAERISVPTTTLGSLIKRFGMPYYVKSDIEGAEILLCKELIGLDQRPTFLSVETSNVERLALLFAAGYDRFQIVNQAEIRRMSPTISYIAGGEQKSWTFGSHSSGPFGADLGRTKWLDFRSVTRLWLDHDRLREADPGMVLDNWFDIHATTNDVLTSIQQ